MCNICFENIDSFGLINCGHLFCDECIRNWAEETNACPLCRKEFAVIKIVQTSSSEFVKVEKKKESKETGIEEYDPILFGFLKSERFLLRLQAKKQRGLLTCVRGLQFGMLSHFLSKTKIDRGSF